MKVLNIFFSLLIVWFILSLLLPSCTRNVVSDDVAHTIMFDYKEIYHNKYYKIVVDGTTGVLYVHMRGESLSGLSPLYNADGSLKVYGGELE